MYIPLYITLFSRRCCTGTDTATPCGSDDSALLVPCSLACVLLFVGGCPYHYVSDDSALLVPCSLACVLLFVGGCPYHYVSDDWSLLVTVSTLFISTGLHSTCVLLFVWGCPYHYGNIMWSYYLATAYCYFLTIWYNMDLFHSARCFYCHANNISFITGAPSCWVNVIFEVIFVLQEDVPIILLKFGGLCGKRWSLFSINIE